MKLFGFRSVISFAKLLLLSKTPQLMKRFFIFCIFLVTLQSCDDGDIIVTTFDFDEIDLQRCGNVGQYVFFKINTVNLETLSLQLNTQDSILQSADVRNYNLSTTGNVVNYRTYNGDISAAYFCSSVPPTTPGVALDYTSTQGTAVVTTAPVFFETTSGTQTDSIVAYTTTILLQNLRLESENESITQETLQLGTVETPAN